ncbi:MAG: pro-sigmaK processing inhibitor BofA family protein [Clostridiales bacterium]|nr:pro-sigmaK processing inhibitor BofA family protein [Clostridiales bacterium]
MTQENFYIAIISIISVLILFFHSQIFFLIKFIFRSSFYITIIYLLNTFIFGKNIFLGVNIITIIVSGFLGLPGIAALCIAKTFI